MLAGDHILISTSLAVICSDKLKLPFVPIATVLILLNCIDYDHIIYFHLDKGNANSLTTHPLHIYSGCIIFIIAIIGLFLEKYRNLSYAIIGGITIHLTGDAIAYWFEYRAIPLLSMALVEIVLMIYLFKNYFHAYYAKMLTLFFLCVWLACSFETYITVFVLKMDPLTSALFWVIPPTLTLISGISFYLLFKEKKMLR